METIKELLTKSAFILEQAGCSSPRLDAELLLSHLLKKDRTYFVMYPEKEIEDSIAANYFELIEQRKSRKPVQYILGHQEFMKLDFIVDENVLIPRPDTEILVEEALKIIGSPLNSIKHVLDIGCGSGSIAISIAHYAPQVLVHASDISDTALCVAKKNSEKHGVSNRIRFFHGDLFCPVCGKYEMIVSNPPYIKRDEIETLQKEISVFEPKAALDGGSDGLDFYRRIIEKAPFHINQAGYILLEIGCDQAEDVACLMENSANYSEISIIKDLSGLNRVIRAEVKEESRVIHDNF